MSYRKYVEFIINILSIVGNLMLTAWWDHVASILLYWCDVVNSMFFSVLLFKLFKQILLQNSYFGLEEAIPIAYWIVLPYRPEVYFVTIDKCALLVFRFVLFNTVSVILAIECYLMYRILILSGFNFIIICICNIYLL